MSDYERMVIRQLTLILQQYVKELSTRDATESEKYRKDTLEGMMPVLKHLGWPCCC